jgi:hypothetical protein
MVPFGEQPEIQRDATGNKEQMLLFKEMGFF